ncbi:MAG: T9SS type A sorting domain-containing protein [Ignavibacteriaceae bacterium]|nr:T9SS type A sorting domain-containing protein [Ignavibacteriaceae bacterium]
MDTSTVVMGEFIPDGGIVKISRFDLNYITENESEQPDEFVLFQNYPNPFNPSTSIQYSVRNRQFVSLKVYDVLGNEIVTLVNEEKHAGSYTIHFNSEELSSGIYIYTLQSGSNFTSMKMILIK